MNKFYEYARYNSGRHFLDSGDAHGRHHEKGPLDENSPIACIDQIYGCDITATIETAPFLASGFDVREDMHSAFDEFSADSEQSWFEDSTEFMESLGYERAARDNVFNSDNDLSQVYVWEVWQLPENIGNDWIYDDDAVTVFFIHTGCDVRGGYSPPIFAKSKGDYTIPVDLVCGFYVTDRDGETYDEFQVGYTSHPSCQFYDKLERVFEFTRTETSVCAKLKDGPCVKIEVETTHI